MLAIQPDKGFDRSPSPHLPVLHRGTLELGVIYRHLQTLNFTGMSHSPSGSTPAFRLDRTAISVSEDFVDRETTLWWNAQTPERRLQHMPDLRVLNSGDRASDRLQRVLEMAELPRG